MTEVTTLMTSLRSALERNDRVAVNDVCRSLIADRARLGGQWRSLILVLLRNGEMTLARAAADTLLRETGNSPLGRFEQAATYARTGRLGQARALLEAVPETVPDAVGNAYIRGTLATNVGDFDEARRHLRRAVRLSPASGQSWLALAMVGRLLPEDAAAMESAGATMQAAPVGERGAYFYALGKMFDERGDFDRAFESFDRGAALVRSARPNDANADLEAVAAATVGWTREAIEGFRKSTHRSTRPIFVTGLPRSGTTLVEQILVSHSSIQDGEEFGRLALLANEMGGIDLRSVERTAAAGRLETMGALYDHLVDERFPGTGRIVDKTLLASRFMGPIAAVFPEVPIVWMRRDPLDNAWSIFRTYFLQDLGWTFDLSAIGRQMAAEDRLFRLWSALRPDQILTVDYAELASRPDQIIPKIVAHCGLTLEPQQLRPHEHERAVTTASVAQVRAPIGTQAIGASEPYRRHLQPFIDAYHDAGGTID